MVGYLIGRLMRAYPLGAALVLVGSRVYGGSGNGILNVDPMELLIAIFVSMSGIIGFTLIIILVLTLLLYYLVR